jgi:hypothetical protein
VRPGRHHRRRAAAGRGYAEATLRGDPPARAGPTPESGPPRWRPGWTGWVMSW